MTKAGYISGASYLKWRLSGGLRKSLLCFLLSLSLFIAYKAVAQPSVNFSVTVISAPPCIFNGGNDVNVDFGNEVLTTRVDGVNYAQPVPYNLTCSPAPPANALKLQLRATDAGFDSALATDNSNLGIRLMNGNNTLAPNTWVNFTWPNTPTINAVPVMRPGTTLTAGPFNGSATLMLDYQ